MDRLQIFFNFFFSANFRIETSFASTIKKLNSFDILATRKREQGKNKTLAIKNKSVYFGHPISDSYFKLKHCAVIARFSALMKAVQDQLDCR